LLHVIGKWHTDEAGNSAQTEEPCVAARGLDATLRPHIDQDLGAPATELPPEREEFANAARSRSVTEIAMDEAASVENGGGRWSFGIDWEVCEKAPLGVREGAGDEMKRGQCNESIAETA